MIRFVSMRFVQGGLSIPSMTTSSWLSASPPPMPMPPGNMKLAMPPKRSAQVAAGVGGRAARSAKSRSRHARVSRIRSPLGVSAPFGP